MPTNNKKRKSKSKQQAYEALRDYRKAERNKKHDLLLQQNDEIGQIQELQLNASRGIFSNNNNNIKLRGNGLSTTIGNDTMKLFDILKEPKAAHIPSCQIPAPFRGKLFTRKRKMDAYESAMYAQALQKKDST